MSSNLPDSYVFVVTGQEPREFGTGFAIHSDDFYTYFVTCSHVLEDVGGPTNLKVGSMAAEIVVNNPPTGYDIAVLRTPKTEVPILKLNPFVEKGTKVSLNGFCLENTQKLLRPLVGRLDNPGKIVSDTHEYRAVCWTLMIDSDNGLEKGYSGSPVCNERSMRVVGVVNQRKGPDKGQVISIEVLKIIWPEYAYLVSHPSEPNLPSSAFEKKEEPLINFEKEVEIFQRILKKEDTHTRFITLYGESSFGKSRLLRKFVTLSEDYSFSTLQFDFKQQTEIERCLETIVTKLGRSKFPLFEEYLINGRPDPFTREKEREWLNNLTRKFFSELSKYLECPTTILFFDHYEKASQEFKVWLESRFILDNLTQQQTPLLVVLAGQNAPLNVNPEMPRQFRFPLEGIPLRCFEQYADQIKANLPADTIRIIHDVCKGAPGPFVTYLSGMGGNPI